MIYITFQMGAAITTYLTILLNFESPKVLVNERWQCIKTYTVIKRWLSYFPDFLLNFTLDLGLNRLIVNCNYISQHKFHSHWYCSHSSSLRRLNLRDSIFRFISRRRTKLGLTMSKSIQLYLMSMSMSKSRDRQISYKNIDWVCLSIVKWKHSLITFFFLIHENSKSQNLLIF